MERTILHFDIDAFFASVEMLDNPSLVGKPVIVGGLSKRGVVSTASYEARKYGIHSAMSMQTARRLCPHGIFLNGHFDRYKYYSDRVFQIMSDITSLYEKVSIDEAYLDLTGMDEDPHLIARAFKQRVLSETGLTISIGLSYNKFLAKLASDWKKPNGFFEIRPEDAYAFLAALPIIKVHGLGKKSVERLNNVGIYTVSELQKMPLEYLGYFLGHSWAKEIYERIRGIDERPIITHHERKSYGKETTFLVDVTEPEQLKVVSEKYAQKLLHELGEKDLSPRTMTLKAKYSDFQQITRSHTFEHPVVQYEDISETLQILLCQLDIARPVRLIGISFSNLVPRDAVQLSLFDL
jgi:DNA polymerase-4